MRHASPTENGVGRGKPAKPTKHGAFEKRGERGFSGKTARHLGADNRTAAEWARRDGGYPRVIYLLS